MIVEQEVDIFLEHFGKKGMKWGVRRAQTHKQSGPEKAINKQIGKAGKAYRKTFSKANPNAKRNKKIVAGVVGTGVVIAGVLIAHKSGVRLSSFRKSSVSARGSQQSAKILSKIGRQRFSAIPMPPVGRAMPRASLSSRVPRPGMNEAKLLRASIAKMIKSTNSDMRRDDNANNVPFADRLQLKEWD